ncbi:MAG: hypothetical protein F7C38_01725 [Desulfurococcales archaeon]|nr:hypothetical protein [Desulfurococcales archaeon]
MGLVDALWGLSLLAGRAWAVGAEFLLSGPLNHWLRGISRGTPQPRYVLLTPHSYSRILAQALRIGGRSIEGPRDLRIVRGLLLHVDLRGYIVTLLEDPIIEGSNGLVEVDVSAEARRADIVLVDNYAIRLAPLSLEAEIWGLSEGDEREESLEG